MLSPISTFHIHFKPPPVSYAVKVSLFYSFSINYKKGYIYKLCMKCFILFVVLSIGVYPRFLCKNINSISQDPSNGQVNSCETDPKYHNFQEVPICQNSNLGTIPMSKLLYFDIYYYSYEESLSMKFTFTGDSQTRE